MSESFGAMLRRLRIRAGLSQNACARSAGIDPAYQNRMEAGKTTIDPGARHPSIDRLPLPRRGVVLSLASALDLSDREADRFLFAAGLAPEVDWQTLAERYMRQIRAITDALAEGADEDLDAEPVVIGQRRRG